MLSHKIDDSAYGTKKTIDHISTIRKKENQLYPSEKKFFLKVINNASTFLDLGCATGNFIEIIRSKTKIKDYLGIDVSKNMIERAKLEYPGYEFLHYDGKFLFNITKFNYSLNLFGYEHKPAKSVTTKYKNVIMTSVLIDKTRKFELKIDLK